MTVYNFESGILGWAATGCTAVAYSAEAHSGSGCMKVTVPPIGSSTSDPYVSYTVGGLTPGFQTITLWAKVLSPTAYTSLTMYFDGNPYAGFNTNADDTWTKSIFHAYTSTTTLTIHLTVQNTSGGSVSDLVLIDDLEVVSQTSFLEGFETVDYADYTGSSGFHAESLSTVQSHSGTQSLLTSYDGSGTSDWSAGGYWATWLQRIVYLVPGYSYTLSIWAYVPAGGPTAIIGLYDYITQTYIQVAETTTNDAWEELTVVFTSEDILRSTVMPDQIMFSSSDPSMSGDVYWDDLSITWTGSEIPTYGVLDYEEYPLSTPRTLEFLGPVTGTAEVVNTVVHGGDQALKVTLPANDGHTSILDKPTYEVGTSPVLVRDDVLATMWLRVPSGSSHIRAALYDTRVDPPVLAESLQTSTHDVWEMLSFTMAEADWIGKYGYTIFFVPVDGAIDGTIFYLDDVSFDQTTLPAVSPALAQSRENTAVNRGLTPAPYPKIEGMCLNADVHLGDLTFNTIDADSVVWVVTDIDGWWVHPDPEVKDYPRGMGDGSYDVQGRWLARNITLSGSFLPPDSSYVPYARDNLIRATNIVHSGTWLRVDENPTKVAYVRLSGKPSIQTVNARGRTDFSVGLRAADPVKYSWNDADPDGYNMVSIPCASTSPSHTGEDYITNAGNTAVRILIQVDGPIVGPARIQNLTTGELILIIGSTDSDTLLEIDTYNQVVALDGDTYGMRSLLDAPTDWIRLTPGTNHFKFEDTGDIDSTATMRVYYRSGWIG